MTVLYYRRNSIEHCNIGALCRKARKKCRGQPSVSQLSKSYLECMTRVNLKNTFVERGTGHTDIVRTTAKSLERQVF